MCGNAYGLSNRSFRLRCIIQFLWTKVDSDFSVFVDVHVSRSSDAIAFVVLAESACKIMRSDEQIVFSFFVCVNIE